MTITKDESNLKGELLYNGIRLPSPWPPRKKTLTLDPPAIPYYVASPPSIIPIDVGRQLFVDDFLVATTTMKRAFHTADYYPENPVLKPDKPWEYAADNLDANVRSCPTAMVFSDGVWYDPKDRLFKMWYMGGYSLSTCYATSADGIHWEKPLLDIVSGTNIVNPERRDSTAVWLDLGEEDPRRRYKFTRYAAHTLSVYVSADGIHWDKVVSQSPPVRDRTTFFYNPFRRVWVYSLRAGVPGIERTRNYLEHSDLIAGAQWKADDPALWFCLDRLDPQRSDLQIQPEVYNLDAVAYESVMLGLFSVWRGQPKDRPKPNDIVYGFSRDGFHWDRPDRNPFIAVSEHYGDWNWGNIQSAGGCCLVVGDKLYFYVSGRAGIPGKSLSGVCSTGLAILRRDGFASMDATGQCALTTRVVCFKGKYLFVNVDAPDGELRVEVLDQNDKPVTPFTLARCNPVSCDKTLQPVSWQGSENLEELSGKPVRLRFVLKNGRLYSFWVSPDKTGASYGYVAAGGPGFSGHIDKP